MLRSPPACIGCILTSFRLNVDLYRNPSGHRTVISEWVKCINARHHCSMTQRVNCNCFANCNYISFDFRLTFSHNRGAHIHVSVHNFTVHYNRTFGALIIISFFFKVTVHSAYFSYHYFQCITWGATLLYFCA